ncbi:hypothetical protein [Sandaracinus amylolyticus]|uniref:hypothetical protein n=1 Tax=Sandaracinus amylolyticus TaxID=927083 RepID=UPI001F23D05D|nr:hypothetical protein [Sandaracinus amylolyticus]UJR78346.1 Hypothetical protein I5071_3730 [Sandaracinus amylolyticus]
MWRRLLRLAHSPIVDATIGVVMVGTALIEIAGEWLEPLVGGAIGAAHGLFVVGVVHTFKALPGLVEGADKIERAREIERERDAA